MKQTTNTYAQHINPIKIALIFAFSIVFLAIAYKATLSNADVRSRAAGDCFGKWKSDGKKKVCKMVKNKKGVSREVCSMEMQYYCAKEEKTLQEGGDGGGGQTTPGGTSLQAVDGSGNARYTPTPTNPPTLQAVP